MTKADREKILKYYKANGDEKIAARLLDLAQSAGNSRRYKVGDFLDRHEALIAETIATHDKQRIRLQWDGGYTQAERRRPIFTAIEYRGEEIAEVVAIAVNWDERFYDIGHRDILGALIALGVERSRIGDIVRGKQNYQAVIICCEQVSSIIMTNLKQAGAATLQNRILPLVEIETREERTKEIKATVATLRIDSICAAGFGISRSRAAEELVAGRYELNWQPVKGAAQAVKAGDVISCRGRGRVAVTEITGQTKKGRTGVLLTRYL